jgi:hypothetical protein
MYKRIWLIVVPLVALSLSGEIAVRAGGTKVGANDGVDALIGFNGVNFYASGALGTVRSEPGDEFQVFNKWIGCWIDSTAGSAMVTCEATAELNDGNTTLHDLRCVSHDPAMVAAVGAMNSDSMITFETPTAVSAGVGQCVHIKVENISKYNARTP